MFIKTTIKATKFFDLCGQSLPPAALPGAGLLKSLTNNFFCCLVSALIILFALSQTADAGSKRTVKDMAGRRVTITGDVNRIVTTFKPATLCVLSLGLQKKLVGLDSSSGADRLNLAVFPDFAKLPGVGSKSMGLNYESIMSLNPELVILYAQKDGRKLADQFESMNIPAIIIFPETLESIKSSLKLIAEAVGEPEKTTRAEKAMETVILLVEKKIATLDDTQKKTAYFASPRGLFSTATGNMLQDEMLTKAGLINVAHDLKGYFQDISPEQFISWNPEIVAISQHMKAKKLKKLDNPAIKNMRAIKNKRVYRCPSNLAPWDFPSPLSVLGILWLANKAYPDLFKETDIQAVVNSFHTKIFGKSLEQMGGKL